MNLTKRFDRQFTEVIKIIHRARYNAIKSINAEQIKLYWSVGEYISDKLSSAQWGDTVVDQLAEYIQESHPEFRGFNRRGLYRMCQFYDTYRNNPIVSPLVTQIDGKDQLFIEDKRGQI